MCHTKVRYNTEQDAEAAVMTYTKRVPINYMMAYECEKHECWHKGHGKSEKELYDMWAAMNWWRLN